MKLQIDTSNKTIKLEDNIKLSEFISNLKKLFPNNEWKDYTLETNTVIEKWNYPIYWQEYIETTPVKKWYEPTYMCGSSTAGECQIYNIEI